MERGSIDNDRFWDSNQDTLRSLLETLAKGRNKKKVTGSGKIRRLLQEHPDLDVNELIDGQSILHIVCRQDPFKLLNVVLERPNVNVNVKTKDGLAGLHIACSEDNIAAVKTLLESPHIDINIRDGSNSRTALHVAAMQGNQAPMKMLLEMAGIDVQSRDLDGYLPVHHAAGHPIHPIRTMFGEYAAENYTDDILLRLCANGAINARTHQERGPLHLAAQAGNTAALKLFLTQPELDINMMDMHGDTALHLVKNVDVAGMLLDHGLDANIQNVDGNTALHCALEWPGTELVDLLLKHTRLDKDMPNKKGQLLMHIAAAKWDLEIFNLVAAPFLPPSVNITDENGETVLHIAARENNIDIVNYVLGIPGVEVNTQNENGSTPLHLACEEAHINIIKSLLGDPFIYVNSRDAQRRTPLHLVCMQRDLEIVRLLLASAHVDAEAGDLQGWTPLHYASQLAGGEPIICELLQVAVDIDKQASTTGLTALHVAALYGNFNTVWTLLEHGADSHITCATALVGSDSVIDRDAAGVASKIEIVDLIRHYRLRKVSLVPDDLSDPQRKLLQSPASSVNKVWLWPRNEASLFGHGNRPRRRRQRIFPDTIPVNGIYARLTLPSDYAEHQWQLRSASFHDRGKWPYSPNVFESQRATRWVHFSAQCRRWIEDFCRMIYSHESLHTEGIDVLTFIDDIFSEKRAAAGYNEHLYREQSVTVSTLPVVTDKETTGQPPRTRIKGLDLTVDGEVKKGEHYSVAAIVVPLIDIDMMTPGFVTRSSSVAVSGVRQLTGGSQYHHVDQELNIVEQAHVDMVNSLQSAFKLQRSRSLDHYFHRDLTDAELQVVNADQVLSRFIYHQQEKLKPHSKQDNFTLDTETPKTRRIYPVWRMIMKALATLRMASNILEDTRIEEGPEEPIIKPHIPRQYVLVVPQLWLWKIDNVLITALPARWDSSNLNSPAEYIRNRVELQEANVSPDKLLHDIVVACLEFQPSLPLFGRQLTYQDAFSGEISRISRDIDQCYKGFRNDLGKSDDRFLDSFKTATTSLLDIDDVLNELTMIKRVYQNQAQVWEDIHKDRILSMECSSSCNPEQSPRRLYTVMARLEEDAHKVRETVVTLLQLTQGSASTENALKASEQSKILAIFTVVTVIFTPLSWVAALFALKIEGFHAEETWTTGQVAGGSVICLVGTLVLCGLGWKWLNRERAAKEQPRGPSTGRRTFKL